MPSNYERYAKAKKVIDGAIKGFMKLLKLDIPPCKIGKSDSKFSLQYIPLASLTTLMIMMTTQSLF